LCIVCCLAVYTKHKKLAATFTSPTATLALVSVLAGVQAFQRKALVEPVIYDLVEDLCNFTTYVRLGRNIPCDWQADFASEPLSECNDFCQARVESLSSLDGCDILPDLCGAFSYNQVSCEDQVVSQQMYSTEAALGGCASKCDDDIACTGYMHNGSTCVLTAGVETQHPPPDWQLESPESVSPGAGETSWTCFERETPVALEDFESYGTGLAWMTVILGAILLVAACSSMMLLYDANVKRRGKPTARNLAMLMCCPCCAGERHQKWRTATLDEEEEDGGDE